MNMTRATIFNKNVNDDLKPKIVIVMTYMKKNWLTRVVQNFSNHKIYTQKYLYISHFQVLGSIVYVFLYKDEKTLKSGK